MAARHTAAPPATNDNQPRRREVYCPPAPDLGLVDRTFKQLFWGARFPVLVAPPAPPAPLSHSELEA